MQTKTEGNVCAQQNQSKQNSTKVDVFCSELFFSKKTEFKLTSEYMKNKKQKTKKMRNNGNKNKNILPLYKQVLLKKRA